MLKPRAFVTRRIPAVGLNRLSEHLDMDVWPEDLPPSQSTLLEKVKGVSGILCLLSDKIDQQVMDAAGPNLKVISQYAVGIDNIDVTAATQRNIAVGNTPGVLTDATADLAWALLMAAARRVVEGDRYARAGLWQTWGPTTLTGPSVSGATLGIIGFGRIGQAMARRARGFDMEILYTSNSRHLEAEQNTGAVFCSLDQLLAQSDFISLHTPLTPSTRGLISTAQFECMKPSSILINTARGPVVDSAALYKALRTRKIAYAALDVTDPEPLPLDSPLYTLDNLVIVPHIGSGSIQTRDKMAEMSADNLLAGIRGEKLPNCVNPQIYTK
jgi:glyoxylate reductase